LYRINTTHYKNALARKLAIPPGDPGAFHLHKNVGQDYIRQMTAEYRDDAGKWVCPSHRANHYWDCEVLALVAADIPGMKFWTPFEEEPEPEEELPGRTSRRVKKW
jgi:phage terminase large subunit GpA-like protein